MKLRVTKTFNAENLSILDRRRLESWLSHIERVVDKRNLNKRQGYPAYLGALNEWLEHPNQSFQSDQTYLYRAIPDDRMDDFIDDQLQYFPDIEGAQQSFARLRSHPIHKQKEALTFASVYRDYFSSNKDEERSWRALSQLYDCVLSAFPNILYCEDDARGRKNVLHLLEQDKRKKSLKQIWRDRSAGHENRKIEAVRHFLATAYPGENVEHIEITVKPLRSIGGAFIGSLAADVMLHNARRLNDVNRTLFVILHELQHRRQLQKIKQLEDGQLSKGTAEYYQARLFRANLCGGYLNYSTTACSNRNAVRDYDRQPVERHANDLAAVPRIY